MDPMAQRAKEIFLELAGSVPTEKWELQLNERCAGNSALQQRVRALLHAHADPKSFLDQAAVDLTLDADGSKDIAERPGTQIGLTSSSSRSAKAAWVSSTWPSNTSQSAARSPSRSSSPGWIGTHALCRCFSFSGTTSLS